MFLKNLNNLKIPYKIMIKRKNLSKFQKRSQKKYQKKTQRKFQKKNLNKKKYYT